MPTKSWFSITHPAFLPKVACGRCDRARREQAGEPSAGEDTQPRAGFSSDCTALGGFAVRDVSQTDDDCTLDRPPPTFISAAPQASASPRTPPAPPRFAQLCPLTRRIIRLVRRGD